MLQEAINSFIPEYWQKKKSRKVFGTFSEIKTYLASYVMLPRAILDETTEEEVIVLPCVEASIASVDSFKGAIESCCVSFCC